MRGFDHFSKQAKEYSQYRPNYPNELYKFLLSCVKERNTVWDCATGNGQAAIALSEYFDKVIATDLSLSQLKHAVEKSNINYYESVAESTPIKSDSINLITIAQALHWFNFNDFYKEVYRVGKTDGIIAAWCYGQCTVSKEVDEICNYFFHDVLKEFWPKQSTFIREEYKTIPFPFEKIDAPVFYMTEEWNLDEFVGYQYTWSATQRYIIELGNNPLLPIYNKYKRVWGEPEKRLKVIWPIHMLVGKIK